MIDPIKKMDFDLKYDGGVLVQEFFLQEAIKGKGIWIRFHTQINPYHQKSSVWCVNPESHDHLFPLVEGKIIKLDDIGTIKDRYKLYVVIGYTGLEFNQFNFRVRRANLIERVIYHLNNLFK